MTLITTEYATELDTWRQQVEIPMRRDWISLVGRFELEPGLSRIGSDPANEIVLPAAAPGYAADLRFDAGVVTLTAAPGAELFVNGTPLVGSATLRSDADGASDIVTLGSLTFFIIQRGPRTILRLRDSNSPVLQRFGGRRWFPADEAYRVEGIFTAYDPPRPLSITNILGDTSGQTSPGSVTFSLDGQQYQLDATGWRDGGLVLHFRDATNRDLSYSGGRALVTAAPDGGLVTLDFNRTSNLPCAFTEFATCPLPPAQNRLPIAIAAGELQPA